MIDSTTARGHSQAAGATRGLIRKVLAEAAAALRARSTSAQTIRGTLSASCSFGGKTSDYKAIDGLIALPDANPRFMLADKSYDINDVRSSLLIREYRRSFRSRHTASRQSPATSEHTGIATVSSPSPTNSSSSVALRPATLKPLSHSWAYWHSSPQSYGCRLMSTEPRGSGAYP